MPEIGPPKRNAAVSLPPATRQRLVDGFLNRAPGLMRDALGAAAVRDEAAVARAAATLAADARTLGLDRFATAAEALAEAATAGQHDTGALTMALARAYAAARSRLARER